MSCVTKIASAVLNACDKRSVGGADDSVVIVNYDDWMKATKTISGTNIMLMTDVVLLTPALAYKFEFVDETMNGTQTFDVATKTYTHTLTGMLNVSSADIKETLNDAINGRFVAIVTNRNPNGDVKFEIYGNDSGMKITQHDKDLNANSANYTLTMASTEKSRESKSLISLFKTDIATTVSLIEGLLT